MKIHRLGALALLSAVLACEPGARKLDPASAPQSTTIAVTHDGTILSLDADHNTVVFQDLAGGNKVIVPVGKGASQLSVRGDRAVVSNRYDRSISVLNTATRSVEKTIPVGVEPHGITFVDDNRVAVVLVGEQAVVLVDLASASPAERFELRTANPRAIAAVGNKLFITHLFDGDMSVVNLETRAVSSTPIRLTGLPNTRLNPSLIATLTASPDNSEVSAPHVNTNNESLRSNPNEGGGGYLGTPDQMPAVNPTLTTVAVNTQVMTSDANPADEPQPFVGDGCFEGCAPNARGGSSAADPSVRQSALLTTQNGAIGRFQLNEPVATAYLDGGRGIAVVGRGSRNVFVWKRDPATGRRTRLMQVSNVGHGADGLAVSADGKNLLVHNAFDLTVSVVPLPAFDEDEEQSTFLGAQRKGTEWQSDAEVPVSNTLTIDNVTLPANVRAGRELFFDATLPQMTFGPGVTCGTCHAEGRNDGRTWQFIDGPRNTPSLAGAAEGRPGIATTTAPLHWKGELGTHRDLQRTVTEFMGGQGLSDSELDDVAAFIDTIPAPDRADPIDPVGQELVARGREIFFRPSTQCATCHAGVHFTDNQNHVLGTGETGPVTDSRGVALIPGYQTPVLHGLRHTAPYLHDGTAPTIEAVLEQLVRTDYMGVGHDLSDDDMKALAAYLRTL